MDGLQHPHRQVSYLGRLPQLKRDPVHRLCPGFLCSLHYQQASIVSPPGPPNSLPSHIHIILRKSRRGADWGTGGIFGSGWSVFEALQYRHLYGSAYAGKKATCVMNNDLYCLVFTLPWLPPRLHKPKKRFAALYF